MVFPVVMYGCASWTINKNVHQRADAFEFCGAWDNSRVPWTAGKSNQSILYEINLDSSLEELMPKLQFQYFGHLMQIADSLEKILMLVKIEGLKREWQEDRIVG